MCRSTYGFWHETAAICRLVKYSWYSCRQAVNWVCGELHMIIAQVEVIVLINVASIYKNVNDNLKYCSWK